MESVASSPASGHTSPADARSSSLTRLHHLPQPQQPQQPRHKKSGSRLPQLPKRFPARSDSRDSLPALPPSALKRTWTKGSNLSIASAATSFVGSEITDGLNLLRNTGSQALKFPYLPPIQVCCQCCLSLSLSLSLTV